MIARTLITVKTEGGAKIKLKRIAGLVAAGGSNKKSEPMRYELTSGEEVKELRANVWKHPLRGEELFFVSC